MAGQGGKSELGCTRRDFLHGCGVGAVSLALGESFAAEGPNRTAIGNRGLVVSVSEPASRVGVEILRSGGNAVDAAVAVAFALAVTYPPAGNIGGGGFMTIFVPPSLSGRFRDLSQPVCVVDYREAAPLKAHKDMFRRGDSPYQHKTVAVPGTVAGLSWAHAHFGRLSWRQLVEPAVLLARDGFAVDNALARSLNQVLSRSREWAELQRVFAPPDGQRWKAGDRLRQPDLAWSLKEIAQGGADAFYRGAIAEKLVAEMQRGGGWITHQDLRQYRLRVRPPIRFNFAGVDVYSPPPPSSGGICLALILRQLEHFPYREWGRWDVRTMHVLIEAMRRAYADRARWLGDPDLVRIPDQLLDPEYASRLARTIHPDRATPSREVAPDIPVAPEGSQTTHFAVVDSDGLAVSNTYTLRDSYGSRMVVRGAGFLLNNEMTDFNWFPGRTTTSGEIGTVANQIAPGKRVLSSMTPTIAVQAGRAVLVTGSPGGRTIINTIAQIVLNRLGFALPPAVCVALPRVHHQWFPDEVRYEPDGTFPQSLVNGLRQRGHRMVVGQKQGDAHSLFYDGDKRTYYAVADSRIWGSAEAVGKAAGTR